MPAKSAATRSTHHPLNILALDPFALGRSQHTRTTRVMSSHLARCEEPRPGEPALAFADRMRPSQVFRTDDRAWLQVSARGASGFRAGRAADRAALVAEVRRALSAYERAHVRNAARGSRVPAGAKLGVLADVYGAALRAGETRGKWMLFVRKDRVDHVWAVVAEATEDGSLGSAARVQPCGELDASGVALVCVICEDFTDLRECEVALRGLKNLGLEVKCGFKPTVLTIAGLDRSVLGPLRLHEHWQLHLDMLESVFPDRNVGLTSRRLGFDLVHLPTDF